MSFTSAQKMIQQQLKNNTTSRLVNSPHAKYDSKGQLKCIVCGVPVKSAIVWQAHVVKKSHLQNLNNLELKQKLLNNKLQGIKRKAAQASETAPLAKKTPINPVISQFKPKGILKGISTYSSSDSDEETDTKPTIAANGLPADFFDTPKAAAASSSLIKEESPEGGEVPMAVDEEPFNPSIYYKVEKTAKTQIVKPNTAENLPEGFFDDPVQDAKVRKVEYVDKDEAEWSTFMREVSAAETTSKAIIDEDAEEAAKRNQILDIEEAIQLNKKVIILDEALKTRQSNQTEGRDNMSEDVDSEDELQFNAMSWRSKNFSL